MREQVIYLRFWHFLKHQETVGNPDGVVWARQDSNLQPTDYESAALTS